MLKEILRIISALTVIRPHRIAAATECVGKWYEVEDTYYFISNDQVDADIARSYCSSWNGNLASLKDQTIQTKIEKLLNQTIISDLFDVWLSINNDTMNYRYSNSSSLYEKETIWTRDNELPRIKLYKKSKYVYKQTILFCYSNKGGHKWNVVLRFDCTDGWQFAFSAFGGDEATLRTLQLHRFQISTSYSSKLSKSAALVDPYNIIPKSYDKIYIPDIRVTVGARSDSGKTDWHWSDSTAVSETSYPVSSDSKSCQQMSLHYVYDAVSDWWEYSSMNCTNDPGFYICESKFSLKAEAMECNSSALHITWTFSGKVPPQTDGLTMKVNVNNKDFMPEVSDGSLVVGGLTQRNNYTIKAIIMNRKCNSITNISSTAYAVTSFGKPDPVQHAWVQNLSEATPTSCAMEWEQNNVDGISGYSIYWKVSTDGESKLLENVAVSLLRANEYDQSSRHFHKTLLLDDVTRNIRVMFQISAYSCEGSSSPMTVTGYCVTPLTNEVSNEQSGNNYVIFYIIAPILALIILLVAALIYRRWRSTKLPMSKTEGRQNQGTEVTLLQGQFHSSAAVVSEFSERRPEEIYENADIKEDELNAESIEAENLLQSYTAKCANNFRLYTKEFKNLRAKSAQKTYSVSQTEINSKKNRYKNIYSYDDSRVILQGGPEEDYINASYIAGARDKAQYIATQGPKVNTVADFWRMIWEQGSSIIVMLCNLKENEKTKCAKYWPEVGLSKTFTHFEVRTTSEERIGGIVKRIFLLSNDMKEESCETEKRTILQFHFVSWPDHGVPNTTTQLMYLYRMVKAAAEEQNDEKIVVHCSAGVGRTGTFIAMNVIFDELEEKSKVDACSAVLKMRENRKDMVQTAEQYIFLNKLVLEHHLFENTDVDAEDLKKMTSQANWSDDVRKEYNNLTVLPNTNMSDVASSFRDRKLEDTTTLPYDTNVVCSYDQQSGQSRYLNASHIQLSNVGFRTIAAQSPIKRQENLFWKIILEKNVKCMVALESQTHEGVSTLEQGHHVTFDDITVNVISVIRHKSYTERSLNVCNNKNNAQVFVTQLHLEGWKDDEAPPTCLAFSDLIGQIQMLQENDGLLLVYCRNGSTWTGTLLTLLNLIERLKKEKKVDVFRTVKDLRDLRPNMVNNLTLYRYCYTFLAEYFNDIRHT